MKLNLCMIALFLLPFLSCKKEKGSLGLEGTWYNDFNSPINEIVRSEYIFYESGKLESNLKVFDLNFKLLGYRGYSTGTYAVANGKLSINIQKSYTTNTPYKRKEDLGEVFGTYQYEYNYSIDQEKRELTLTIICPPNASCVGAQIYKYQQ